jgi:hypothetical protein
MFHPEMKYIVGHIGKLSGLFMNLELFALALARRDSVITSCLNVSNSLQISFNSFLWQQADKAGLHPQKL